MKTTMVMGTMYVLMACACGGTPDRGGGEPASETESDDSGRPAVEAPTPAPVGNLTPEVLDGGAAPDAIAPACSPLGATCTTSADCLCGKGAGCMWDNVECRAGTCQLENKCVPDQSADGGYNCDGSAGPLLPMLDAGYPCCSQCEMAYDLGGTMSAWLACNATCGAGQCPVTCYSADTHL